MSVDLTSEWKTGLLLCGDSVLYVVPKVVVLLLFGTIKNYCSLKPLI